MPAQIEHNFANALMTTQTSAYLGRLSRIRVVCRDLGAFRMGIVSVPLLRVGAISARGLRGKVAAALRDALDAVAGAVDAVLLPGVGGRLIPIKVIAGATGSQPLHPNGPQIAKPNNAYTVNPPR